jgi:glycosyltransferase involved in cell wall biosynthesis
MRPLVSIIMPAFNAERFIGEAIISVLAQTYDNWELLIVNDGSTDATSAVIASFTDPRIRVFHQINKGIGSARNLGLDHVRGSLLCGLDSDDMLPSDSLECRVSVFEAEPHTDIVDGRVLFMDGELKNTVQVFVPDFEGDPFADLIAFTGKSFMGFSWDDPMGAGTPGTVPGGPDPWRRPDVLHAVRQWQTLQSSGPDRADLSPHGP